MDVLVIAISCVLCVAFLSKANIKISITHNYPQPVDKPTDNSHDAVAQLIEDTYEKENDIPTFDDVLKLAQEMIGGDNDGD